MDCLLCQPPEAAGTGILDHLRLFHPDAWDGPGRWPDGALVVIDETLQPSDFAPPPREAT